MKAPYRSDLKLIDVRLDKTETKRLTAALAVIADLPLTMPMREGVSEAAEGAKLHLTKLIGLIGCDAEKAE